MAINPVSSTTSSSSASLGQSRATMADNFDTFLSILTTQLKNQNPLDPLDTNQFTQQLVQFSSVEQQLKTNDYLEALLAISSTSQSTSAQAMSLIGKEVTVQTAASELKSGSASWLYNLDKAAASAKFTIRDATGSIVHESEKAISAGEGRFVWDGKAKDGVPMADGTYSITIEARDATGAFIPVKTQMAGKVDGVDLTGAEPYLIVGKARLSVSSVISVRNS